MAPIFSVDLIAPFVIAFFLSINMGGSGIAPSFSAAFGANALKKNLVSLLFGAMVFLGAIVAGEKTAQTIGGQILEREAMGYMLVSIVLFSVGASLLFANLLGVPQSTSQSTVFALVAPALYFNRFSGNKLFFQIIPSWFILPMVSFFVCFLLRRYLFTARGEARFPDFSRFENHQAINVVIVVASMYVAFSVGANNVANATGPVMAMLHNNIGELAMGSNSLPFLATAATAAAAFGFGGAWFGHKVLSSTGANLVDFGKFEALIISLVSATLLLIASITAGIPTSLVQLNVGAILGIGVARAGVKSIVRKTDTKKFFVVWIISPIFAFLLSLALIHWAYSLGAIK